MSERVSELSVDPANVEVASSADVDERDAPVVEVDAVTVAFGGNVVLDDVSLSFGPGISGLVGPNGAGKTTVFNVISGYVRPPAGRLLLRGRDVSRASPATIGRHGVGRTFQAPKLIASLSVLDNVMLGATRTFRSGHLAELLASPRARREEHEAQERSRRLLATFGLGDRAGAPAGAISLGSQKIVEIARALVSDPEVVLLDEPAAGLSARDVDMMVAGITTVAAERALAIVVIEHDLHLVSRLCARLSVLNFGRVIADGAPADVVRQPTVIEAYLGAPRDRRA